MLEVERADQMKRLHCLATVPAVGSVPYLTAVAADAAGLAKSVALTDCVVRRVKTKLSKPNPSMKTTKLAGEKRNCFTSNKSNAEIPAIANDRFTDITIPPSASPMA